MQVAVAVELIKWVEDQEQLVLVQLMETHQLTVYLIVQLLIEEEVLEVAVLVEYVVVEVQA
jgi:hypothetical protein